MATATVTGNPVTLVKPANVPLVSFTISKTPVQSGSGTASWENQRYVEGFSSIAITNGSGTTWGTLNIENEVGEKFYAGTLNLTTGVYTKTHRTLIFNASTIPDLFENVNGSSGISGGGILWYNRFLTYNADWSNPASGGYPTQLASAGVGEWSSGTAGFRVRAYTSGAYTNRAQIVSYYPQWTTTQSQDTIVAFIEAQEPQIVYPLASSQSLSFSPLTITPPSNVSNMAIAVPSGMTISVTYEVKDTWNISLPNDWTASSNPARENTTVTLTYNGIDTINSVRVIGVETLNNYTATSIGNNKWTFTMPSEDVGVTVTSTTNYPITTSQNSGGTISTLPSYAPEGQTITFTVTPNTGYNIYNVSSNQVEINRNVFGTYSFIMPASAVSIVVQFQTAPVGNIVVEPQPGGTITANPTTAQEGETVTLTISTMEGYTFQGVVVTRGNHLVSTTKVDDTHYTFVVENL